MEWTIGLVITVTVISGLGGYAMKLRIATLQERIREMRRDSDIRVAEVKRKALAEIRQQREAKRSAQDVMSEIRAQERREWAEREEKLVAQITDLASRPPIMIPAAGPDIAALIAAIGKSVAEVAYGPEAQRKPMTEEEIQAKTLNLVGGMNETLGGKEGEWMPDVELDEWMERNGVPARPGAIAGTGPPQMQATPESYLGTGDELLPPGVVGIAAADRADSDTRVFRSGESAGAAPVGGVE